MHLGMVTNTEPCDLVIPARLHVPTHWTPKTGRSCAFNMYKWWPYRKVHKPLPPGNCCHSYVRGGSGWTAYKNGHGTSFQCSLRGLMLKWQKSPIEWCKAEKILVHVRQQNWIAAGIAVSMWILMSTWYEWTLWNTGVYFCIGVSHDLVCTMKMPTVEFSNIW